MVLNRDFGVGIDSSGWNDLKAISPCLTGQENTGAKTPNRKPKSMTRHELTQYIKDRAEIAERIITFHVLNRIETKWKTPKGLRDARSKDKQFWMHNSRWFRLEPSTLEKIVTKPRVDGKRVRIATEVFSEIERRGNLKRSGSFTQQFKSGKHFSVSSGWKIPFDVLDELFALRGSENDPFRVDSSYYTDAERKIIGKYVLGTTARKSSLPDD